MDLCGSSTDSWFYTDPPAGSSDVFPNLDPSNTSTDPAAVPEHKKWSLQLLEALQHFSRQYQPIHGNICVILCTFGLLTNILNFIVLTRPNMRTSINMVLAAVALCDAGTMCSYLIYVVHFYVVNRGVCLTEIYTYNWMVFILFHSLWSILLHSSSIWLAVLLAFMRLTVMRKAKLSHSFLKPGHVWRPMSYIYAPLAALCIPVIFTHSVVQIELEPCVSQPLDNGTMDLLEPGGPTLELGIRLPTAPAIGYTVLPSPAALTNDCLLLRAVLLINGLCFKLLPCLLLVFSIWRLLRTLAAAKKRNTRVLRRRSETGAQARNVTNAGTAKYFSSRTTKMLLIILLIFLITELPQAFIATLSGFYPSDVYFKIYPTVGDVLDLLSLLNSGVNFVLYCGMSSRFRSTFIDLFAPSFLRTGLRCSRSRFSVSDNDNPITLNGASGLRTGLISPSFVGSSVAANSTRRALSVTETKFYSSFDPVDLGGVGRRRLHSVATVRSGVNGAGAKDSVKIDVAPRLSSPAHI